MSGDAIEPTTGPTTTGDRPGEPSGQARRARPWWTAGLAFVVGLFAGAVVLALLSESPPRAIPTTSPPAATTTADSPTPSPGATGEITVNEACLRVVNETRDVIDAIEELGESAADLDITGVNQAIRALQPLEGRLRTNLAGCEADTTLPGDLDPLPTPSSSPAAPTTGD